MSEFLKHINGIIFAVFFASLTGCGAGHGGADDDVTSVTTSSGSTSSGASAAALPSSGVYAYLLTGQGLASSPKLGISLVHPSATGVEYIIEPSSSAVSDVKVVSSGVVNASTATISNIQPYALLYIVGGDVRRLPLVANGAAPLLQLKKAGSNVACKFVIDANDYAVPANSRYIVSTAGADGKCGTADDSQGEVTLDASGGVSLGQPSANDSVIDMLRDPVTLSPYAWVRSSNILFWSPSSMLVLRLEGQAPLTQSVVQTYNSIVVESGNQLTVLNYSSQQLYSETKLDPVITSGTGWKSIGFDGVNYYVYRNSGATTASRWSVLKISRQNPVATQLASGTGLAQAASLGANLIYVTVLGASNNSLLTINKTTPGTPQIIENTATSTLTMVLTSNSTTHLLWRITGVNSSTPSRTIDMVNEQGNSLYSASGGVPLGMPDAATVNLNLSENRSRFLLATPYGTRAFGDASVVAYDTYTKTAKSLGTLPGTIDYGAYPVFASITGASTDFMAGFANSIVSGSMQNSGAKVFSVNFATSGSLKFTTSTR